MPDWLTQVVLGSIGGIVAAFAAVVTMRADLRHFGGRVRQVEKDQRGFDDKYVTRREFNEVMKRIEHDLSNMNEAVNQIRDVVISFRRSDRDLP